MEFNLNNYEKKTIGNSASGLIIARTHERAHLVPTIQAGEIEAYIVNDTTDNYVNLYSQKFVLYAFSKDFMKIYDDNGIGSLFEAEEIRLWTRDNVCVVELSNAPEAPKRTRDEIRDELYDLLEDLDDSDIIEIYNNWANDKIWEMSELDDELGNMSPTEILESVESSFSTNDYFFYYNGSAYESSDCVWDFCDQDELTDALLDGEVSADDDRIRALVEEYNKAEEED